jgi:hypothetical protein
VEKSLEAASFERRPDGGRATDEVHGRSSSPAAEESRDDMKERTVFHLLMATRVIFSQKFVFNAVEAGSCLLWIMVWKSRLRWSNLP